MNWNLYEDRDDPISPDLIPDSLTDLFLRTGEDSWTLFLIRGDRGQGLSWSGSDWTLTTWGDLRGFSSRGLSDWGEPAFYSISGTDSVPERTTHPEDSPLTYWDWTGDHWTGYLHHITSLPGGIVLTLTDGEGGDIWETYSTAISSLDFLR